MAPSTTSLALSFLTSDSDECESCPAAYLVAGPTFAGKFRIRVMFKMFKPFKETAKKQLHFQKI